MMTDMTKYKRPISLPLHLFKFMMEHKVVNDYLHDHDVNIIECNSKTIKATWGGHTVELTKDGIMLIDGVEHLNFIPLHFNFMSDSHVVGVSQFFADQNRDNEQFIYDYIKEVFYLMNMNYGKGKVHYCALIVSAVIEAVMRGW